MRCAENHVDGVGARLEDRRHGIDHDLDAFVRGKQAKCQDDGLAAEAELRLGEMRIEKGNIRDSMRDHLDPL
jgi:hypothetical protein